MDDEQQTRDEISRIVSLLEEIIGRRSRWDGVVELSEDDFNYGRASWGGNIVISESLVGQEVRWRTQIHEALHPFSQGLTPNDYFDFRGSEEGVIEKLQRHLRDGGIRRRHDGNP